MIVKKNEIERESRTKRKREVKPTVIALAYLKKKLTKI